MILLPIRIRGVILGVPMHLVSSLAMLLFAAPSIAFAGHALPQDSWPGSRVGGPDRPPGPSMGEEELKRLLTGKAPGKPAARGSEQKPGGSRAGKPGPSDRATAEELVRGAEEYSRERREELRASAPERFKAADLDGNGWISYREASTLLEVSKTDYLEFDADEDGRWKRDEFLARDAQLLDTLGSAAAPLLSVGEIQRRREELKRPLPPGSSASTAGRRRSAPLPSGAAAPPPSRSQPPTTQPPSEGSTLTGRERKPRAKRGDGMERSAAAAKPEARPRPTIPAGLRLYPAPGQLLALYDQDHSRGLSLAEVEVIVQRIGNELSSSLILQQTDRDKDGELKLPELGALAFFVSDRISPELRRDVEELSRSAPGTGVPEDPALRAGPFSRLDSNSDGHLDTADLRRLLGGLSSAVRLEAVIAALDESGDGGVDPAEFRRALGGEVRSPREPLVPAAPGPKAP